MANRQPIELKASDLAKEIPLNIKISGFRTFRTRLWIARQLIRLATFVVGSDGGDSIEVEPQAG